MTSSPYINHFIQPDTIIPNPADPQSWNRYSYVQNNPIRYTDPTGHYECMVESDGSCAEVRKVHIWKYSIDTLKELGGKDDLEAMVRIVAKAERFYGSFKEMIPLLSGIFLGVEETNPSTIIHARDADPCAALGRSIDDCSLNKRTGAFGDEGFNRNYRDGFSQPFHFWAYLATTANTWGAGRPGGYLAGQITGNLGNIYHEILHPDGAGATWQDYALAQAGMEIGGMINKGAIQPNELAGIIHNYLGTDGPRADYVIYFKLLFPLQGN